MFTFQMIIVKYRFNMEYNLLQKQYDNHCNLFILELISLDLFMKIEEQYIKKYALFVINLN